MKLTKEQETKFIKLGISSWSELALIIPHSYEDLRLHDSIQIHKSQLIDATVESIYKAPNSIQINFYSHNFGHTLVGVLFRPKPYMIHQYKIGERDFYYGKIECKVGHCSITMPKKMTKVGQVTPKYKSKLRSDVLQRFIEKNLTTNQLINEGLPLDIAEVLISLHFDGESYLNELEPSIKSLNALKYCELYLYMKDLQEKRRYFPTIHSVINEYTSFKDTLAFKLTEEQINTIEEIKEDLSKDVAAKRMIVGDVGSGKTIVILASAYLNRGHRSILMAPTTILANQLFEEAKKYLGKMKITLVTNKHKKENLSKYDFIIGTHALLYRELPDASLVMVDEQHRFGTKQRNMLEKLVSQGEKKPHYLQFSATPIPRTQAMIETAHIDVSLITSTPFKKDIDSLIIQKNDFKLLLKHIKDEISKKNQILIVYPLVEMSESIEYQSIEESRGYWEKNFKNVYVTHGKDKDKEEVLLDFREKGDILIATTVVEVGISLPRLTTVIIVGAERLGLSTLHQLRGRVSRTGLKGYCFLYTNNKSSKRLNEFIKTNSGFDIANLDLKFRKSGDLLKGNSQSGSEFKWIDIAEDINIVRSVLKSPKIRVKYKKS